MGSGQYLKEWGAIMWINSKIFNQSTQNYFSFLKEYGMDIVDGMTEECVRFESCNTWLEIWFDKYSLFVKMGLTKKTYELSLWDIVEYTNGSGNDVFYMASNEEQLQKGLQKQSDYVKLYCKEALLGNIQFYKEILQKKEMQEQENSMKYKNRNVEERARYAWENGDYNEVVALYQSIKEDLTPIQEKRLSLSLRKINE